MDIKVDSNIDDVVNGLRGDIDRYQKQLKSKVFDALTVLEAAIVQNIRSGSGLHVRSGSLMNSIAASKRIDIDENGFVSGSVGPQGIPYAAIHEFGGVTKAHDIMPRVKQSLRFQMGGKEVFTKIVHHPGSNIPARPYMRPAYESTKDKIIEQFGLFLKASFPVKG